MAKRMAILVLAPGILLMSNCDGNLGSLPITSSVNDNSQASETQKFDEIIVFCGNPGVGKSALCNSIFQEHRFDSGTNVGEGMTKGKQEHIYENKKYIDTPGLADVKAREQAAKEIERALKENDNYKIIFVALLDAARVRASDLVTINTVCDAIKTPFEYGLIFNKITRPTLRKIGTTDNLDKYLTDLHKQPASTLIIAHEDKMHDEDNVYLDSNSENRQKLIKFIADLKANRIEDQNVQALDVRDYEKEAQIMESKITALETKLQKQAEESEKLRQLMSIINSHVAIKSCHGTYFRAHPGGEHARVDMQTQIGPWERFYVQHLGGNIVAFKSSHGTYVRAEIGKDGANIDLQTFLGPWEQFTINWVNGSWTIQSCHGNYLRSHPGGEGARLDQSTVIDQNAKFQIEKL